MIEAHHLTLRLGRATILDNVSLAAPAGKLTVLIGPNGAGKSTALKCLTGELRPDGGTVMLAGRAIDTLSAGELARRRAVLPQSSVLSFPFTVAEVVELGLRAGQRRPSERAIAQDALDLVGMRGFSDRLYQTLSGGEQQRVHLARVLTQVWEPVAEDGPRYLFLDEPTSSLDIRHQIDVLEIATGFARRGGGVVVVLHDLELAASYADRLIVLQRGRVVATGDDAHAIVAPDLLRSVYGLDDAMIAKRWPAMAQAR
ncbi:iron complex transport system ATP-binding protein [Breoghania corrubedonensis]|uniref:Iron complex transport system ATP-binding protein n=1 Tax=Breoghania corrubedonensis TaxID=665038 RepID=A0A2T5VCX5_9HYPH|nr:heme ABC transporter ATP-binding protein [Breoghania corrubedonensis]PTW61617.1 iron complex transport system ATP-binding protein [Breoghania corrubedonensis]